MCRKLPPNSGTLSDACSKDTNWRDSTVLSYYVAILTIEQGRLTNGISRVKIVRVVGIATVELNADVTYYFDCITDQNNGSGLVWARRNSHHRFEVDFIPNGSPGKRLWMVNVEYRDLDVYICSDGYHSIDDVTFINITGGEC